MPVLFLFTTINKKTERVLLICLEADLYTISEPVAKDLYNQ